MAEAAEGLQLSLPVVWTAAGLLLSLQAGATTLRAAERLTSRGRGIRCGCRRARS